MARRLGAKGEWIAALRREPSDGDGGAATSLDGIEESWRTAIAYAEQVTESGHAVDCHSYERLARHWTEGEIVEITFVAGLFATHPLHVESVAWVSERKDLLSALFGFLVMGAWGSWTRRRSPGACWGRCRCIWSYSCWRSCWGSK